MEHFKQTCGFENFNSCFGNQTQDFRLNINSIIMKTSTQFLLPSEDQFRSPRINILPTDEGYISLKVSISEKLQEIITDPYYAENNTETTITKTLIPSYASIIVFAFGGPTTFHAIDREIVVEQCQVIGPLKQAFDYSIYKGGKLLVIGFKGDSFYRFFGSTHSDINIPINPDQIQREYNFTKLWHELNTLKNVEEKVDLICEFFESNNSQRIQLIDEIADFYNRHLDPIKAFAQDRNQTERNIQLLHKKYLGYSAKELSRFHRFMKAIDFVQKQVLKNAIVDWMEVVQVCGFYDQSQLIREFKYYLNITPKKYLDFQKNFCG